MIGIILWIAWMRTDSGEGAQMVGNEPTLLYSTDAQAVGVDEWL